MSGMGTSMKPCNNAVVYEEYNQKGEVIEEHLYIVTLRTLKEQPQLPKHEGVVIQAIVNDYNKRREHEPWANIYTEEVLFDGDNLIDSDTDQPVVRLVTFLH